MTGKNGYVLGIDLKPIEPFTQEYVRTIIADFNDPDIVDQILSFLPREADAVISDAAPNITGVWEVDQAKQIDLATKALEIAQCVLHSGGNFFVKLFEGEMFNEFILTVKEVFDTIKIVKPEASRQKSSEMYLLALGLKSKKCKEES
jgi:23S rRNA (uridine2552-2'-O)-methyltransferase